MEITEDVRERKGVLRAERQQQRVFGRGSLQLEVELSAEPLAERQRPRLVDAAAERGVQYELHAARLVEEALENECLLRRDHAQRRPALEQIAGGLFGAAAAEAGFCLEPAFEIARLGEPFRLASRT